MSIKYDVGTKAVVEVEIKETDNTDIPYLIQDTLTNGDIIDTWISEGQLESLIESTNPELKRKRIQSEIEKLQKELEGIN